ncbi:MAG TPA: adenosine deaminase family protein [Dehalococcoidia bacterium]|nr:adenosine deaminase family protein [Dehalococcoidia bacterium]
MDAGAVPKVELHCHLDGVVDAAMLRGMPGAGLRAPVAPEALEAVTPARDFETFLRWFDVAAALEGDIDNYRPVIAAHIQRLKAQNVVYAEVFIGQSELPASRDDEAVKLRDFRAYVDSLEGGSIQVELLAQFNRTKPPEVLAERVERTIWAYERGLIRGFVVAGWPEAGFPMSRFRSSFERLRDAGVPVEVHAGEWAGPESVRDALDNAFPRRIGHGVSIFDDPELVKRVRDEGIHVEMCPTSNVVTGAVARLGEHPIARALAAGVSISVNTDDPGAFGSTMDGEFRLLHETFGFGEAEFAHIFEASLAARFASKLKYLPD